MKHVTLFICLIMVAACGGPEPRRPVKVRSGTYIKEAVERNKKLLAQEEKLIQRIIQNDSLNFYRNSGSGSWYHYVVKNDSAPYTPQTDDLVTLRYNLMTLHGDTLYSEDDIGTIVYKVDKQELFPGLRHSVKLLKEHETATFLYPSSLGYGVKGDNDEIGINVPLKSTLTLLKIEKQQDSIQN